jgi:SAM-dependent methyltransferase
VASGEWFEDEEFWTAYAPTMFDEERWAEVTAVVDAIEALVRPSPGAAVLDACCGPGRHSLEFAARGYEVTGVDITDTYLEAARESAVGLANARFLRVDIRELDMPAAFDLAINLYTSFGYFRDREEDVEALRRIRAALREGGSLVLETTGKETAVRDFTKGESFRRAGWDVRTEFAVVGAWEGLSNRWIASKDGSTVDKSFVLRLYAGTELRSALLGAGFSEVRIFGDLDGSPYDQDAKSLVALARA